MVSGSKLKCPSKVSWEVSFSLYYTVIYGNCLGNVVIGMEKCVKMWKNVLETRFLYTTCILYNISEVCFKVSVFTSDGNTDLCGYKLKGWTLISTLALSRLACLFVYY